MVNEYLVKYVRQMRENGIDDKQIRSALSNQGYSESEISGALWHDIKEDEEKEKASKKPRKKTPIVILVVSLSILWILGLLYLKIWNPSWNPFLNTNPNLEILFF